jgi:YesN/AraC family two-component response regulator
MYISPQYLNKLFHAYMNNSVGGYIQQLRVKEAARLLRETDLSIGLIMEEVGYYDRKFFNKTFKKIEGVFPKEYRENIDSF